MPVTTRSASVLARLIDLRGLGRVDLDGFRKRRHAAIEGVGDGLGPRVDMLVDGVDAADPQVFEAADDLAERALGFAGNVGDGAFGCVGDLRQRPLGGAAGVVERLRRGDRIGLQRVGELLHADFELFGDRAGAGLDLAGDRLGASEPKVLVVAEHLVERALGFAGDGAEACARWCRRSSRASARLRARRW